MATYKKLEYNGSKIQVQSAIEDKNGNDITSTYSKATNITNGSGTNSLIQTSSNTTNLPLVKKFTITFGDKNWVGTDILYPGTTTPQTSISDSDHSLGIQLTDSTGATITPIYVGSTSYTVSITRTNYQVSALSIGSSSATIISESQSNTASTDNAYAYGVGCSATGLVAQAEGYYTNATMMGAKAEGYRTEAGLNSTEYNTFKSRPYNTKLKFNSTFTGSFSGSAGNYAVHCVSNGKTFTHIYLNGKQLKLLATGPSNNPNNPETIIIISDSSGTFQGNTYTDIYIAGIIGVTDTVESYIWSFLTTNTTSFIPSSVSSASSYAHAEGSETKAKGSSSHAEGYASLAKGSSSHAEGNATKAIGIASHTEGTDTTANGVNSHAEGALTYANGNYTHVEGQQSQANGSTSHAEGYLTNASGAVSHAEGLSTTAGEFAHSEGAYTNASGQGSHAEGLNSKATSSFSHAEGNETQASAISSHSEGDHSIASGAYSHAEGNACQASNECTHAEGNHTITGGNNQHVQGVYNASVDENYIDIVGYGTSSTRKNISTLDINGNLRIRGDLYVKCTNNQCTDGGTKLTPVSGVNDGTNWTSLTIDGTTKAIPAGGSGSSGPTIWMYPGGPSSVLATASPSSLYKASTGAVGTGHKVNDIVMFADGSIGYISSISEIAGTTFIYIAVAQGVYAKTSARFFYITTAFTGSTGSTPYYNLFAVGGTGTSLVSAGDLIVDVNANMAKITSVSSGTVYYTKITNASSGGGSLYKHFITISEYPSYELKMCLYSTSSTQLTLTEFLAKADGIAVEGTHGDAPISGVVIHVDTNLPYFAGVEEGYPFEKYFDISTSATITSYIVTEM